jgi:flagellar biosynthetic protein FlhB
VAHDVTTGDLARSVVTLSAPVLLVASVGVTAASLVQSGGVVSFARWAPRSERLLGFSGTRELFSAARVFAFFSALLSVVLIGCAGYGVFRALLPGLASSPGELRRAIDVGFRGSEELAIAAAVLALALGGIDRLIAQRAWNSRWMMTRSEARREQRESEGDPELKAAQRRAYRGHPSPAALDAVTAATLVVANALSATALRYDEGSSAAPRVVAQGRGLLAKRLIELAHIAGVPVVREPGLAAALSELELGEAIPPTTYEAVAELLRRDVRRPPP